MRSDAFRKAAESKDFSAVDKLFTEDVAFRSPVVFGPYEGRDALRLILSAVVEVFEDFEYVEQLEDGDVAMLLFKARVGEREVDGVDVLRFAGDGQVRELMVMVRPMSGVHALAEAMRAKLEAAVG
jgi:ketosteroid isomerase-like protein